VTLRKMRRSGVPLPFADSVRPQPGAARRRGVASARGRVSGEALEGILSAILPEYTI